MPKEYPVRSSVAKVWTGNIIVIPGITVKLKAAR